MGFEAFLGAGPIKLAGQETSPVFEFSVPDEAQEMFLRVVALWRDNEPLGGQAPTFKIRAGRGDFVSVGPDSGDVSISSGTIEVGSVRCQRHQHDVFLLTVSRLVENSGPWKIRITNNDSETLRFLGFSSHRDQETLQPWLVLGDPSAFGSGVLRFVGAQTRSMELRNWGTAPLTFGEAAGAPLGGDGSPVVLVSRPDRVSPHDVGQLKMSTSDVLAVTRRFVHVLRCNDTFTSHGRLNIDVEPPSTHEPFPESSEFFCRRGCGCLEYLPSTPQGGPCERGICGHSAASHHPI